MSPTLYARPPTPAQAFGPITAGTVVPTRGRGPLGEGGSPGCSWKPWWLISKKPAEGQEGWGKAQDGFRFQFTQGIWMGGEGIAGTASQGQVVVAQLNFGTWTRPVAQRGPMWPLSQL